MYRYSLMRQWDTPHVASCLRTILWVMLNPSTADGTKDDPTIRKCVSISQREGFHKLFVVNLYAYRAPDPKDLFAEMVSGTDVVGWENDVTITMLAQQSQRAVCAWGAARLTPAHDRRKAVVEALLLSALLGENVLSLGKTQSGEPKHPLYLALDTPLVPYP